MTIYVFLLLYVSISGGVIYSQKGDKKSKNTKFLNLVFIAIFLLYSLRANTVGIDMPGYFRAYEASAIDAFSDLTFGNFESGYLYLMWICNRLHLSFQVFLGICNIIILFPIYAFIRKYSENAFLSSIIYICYMFFEFNMTGMRQAIATSIVLIAIMVLLESKHWGIVKYCLIVYLATLFHTGAFIGFFYVPFHFIKKVKVYSISIASTGVLFLLFRGHIMNYIKNFFDKDSMHADAGLYIGLNMCFLIALALLFLISGQNRELRIQMQSDSVTMSSEKRVDLSASVLEKIFYLSIATLFLFGSDTAVRSYMLLNQVIIVVLPNSLKSVFNKKSQLIMAAFFTVFFFVFFFTNTLLPNNFDIVPYKFFWQV